MPCLFACKTYLSSSRTPFPCIFESSHKGSIFVDQINSPSEAIINRLEAIQMAGSWIFKLRNARKGLYALMYSLYTVVYIDNSDIQSKTQRIHGLKRNYRCSGDGIECMHLAYGLIYKKMGPDIAYIHWYTIFVYTGSWTRKWAKTHKFDIVVLGQVHKFGSKAQIWYLSPYSLLIICIN